MKILSSHKHIPFGPYVGEMKVDPDFCKRLLELGKILKEREDDPLIKITAKKWLPVAGNIHHEYSYDLKKDSWLEEEFKIFVNTWIAGFRQFTGNVKFDPKYKLTSLWINFQRSGEYQPVHTHPNRNLSFILFLEIPKEMLEEKQTTQGIPAGHTGFIYGEDVYGIITQQIIKPEIGTLLMFPSNLRHYVSHFNAKVTRTSVSGDVTFF